MATVTETLQICGSLTGTLEGYEDLYPFEKLFGSATGFVSPGREAAAAHLPRSGGSLDCDFLDLPLDNRLSPLSKICPSDQNSNSVDLFPEVNSEKKLVGGYRHISDSLIFTPSANLSIPKQENSQKSSPPVPLYAEAPDSLCSADMSYKKFFSQADPLYTNYSANEQQIMTTLQNANGPQTGLNGDFNFGENVASSAQTEVRVMGSEASQTCMDQPLRGGEQASCIGNHGPTTTKRRYRKRTKTGNVDSDTKLDKFRERNRQAATRCRLKKKERTNELQSRARDLQITNQRLEKTIQSLKDEVLRLQAEILNYTYDRVHDASTIKDALGRIHSSAMGVRNTSLAGSTGRHLRCRSGS